MMLRMRSAELKTKPARAAKAKPRLLDLDSNGMLMTPEEYDAAEVADAVRDHRFELIHGVLIVSPPPLLSQRDPNEELGHLLRTYGEQHPLGRILDFTVGEQGVKIGPQRRVADRALWCGLGRLPRADEAPTIVVEFVSKGKRDRIRDYEEKLREYPTIGVKEYWIFDRFVPTLTVFTFQRSKVRKRVFAKKDVYETPVLPGFKLSLTNLFDLAQRWD